jgi:hypothetical protein
MKDEAGNYVWKKDKDGLQQDNPVDRNNHLMDALRYLCMSLPFDLKDCYISSNSIPKTKETLLDRIRPDTDIDKLLNSDGLDYGGMFGLGAYDMN